MLGPDSKPRNVQVTIRAELFGDQTTSHGAAGYWEPYKLGVHWWLCGPIYDQAS